MADNALLYSTLDRVIAASADGSWNQKTWVEINECGSAFCYAGHLLHSQGWQAVRLPEQPSWATFGLTRNGEILTWTAIGERAAEELDLTTAEADALFEEDNTLALPIMFVGGIECEYPPEVPF